ncbi:MAG: hypothetical protein RLZZ299_1101 [Pseudomonadota bacterium]
MRTFLRHVPAAAVLAAALAYAPSAEAKFVSPYNHPDLDWYSIETEHFVVHYPQSRVKEGNDHYLTAEWTAKKAAKVSEEMWPKMCAEFNWFLKEKIHIVILNQSDELEGFTIPSWDWIEVSANPGLDFYRQRGRMDWLPDVLVHEFAHVVSLKANATLSEGTQAVSIGGLYSDGLSDTENGVEFNLMDNDPFYWTEGGAEYWSDESGYNWWTPSRDMHIRTTVLEDRLLSYDEWQTRAQSFRWGDGERGYQQGYSFALYLRQRFGNTTYQKFALESNKGWRLDWNDVIEEVTGVPAETLYNDWVAYITKKYQDQYAKVKAEGEVVGQEVAWAPQAWEYEDPAGRDAWFDPRWKRKSGPVNEDTARIEREKARERTGTWQMVPRISEDGGWMGVNSRGLLSLAKTSEASVNAFTGAVGSDRGLADLRNYSGTMIPADFMAAWDFVPGKDSVVVSMAEDSANSRLNELTGVKPELDGYNWKSLWVIPIPHEQEKDGNVSFTGYKADKVLGREVLFSSKQWKTARKIPNTARGIEPTVSPDGKKVAYLEYTDGVLNLVTINLDGTEKKRLTNFDDGTWMQRADWSPDGTKLAVALFRNFQQDIWVIDAQTGAAEPLMYDRWEDQDPFWAKDGSIWFSSDPNGIFNVFRWDPATKKIAQVTNVIGGAQAPSLTPEGNLLYSYYTGHGWKVYGLAKEDYLMKDATASFTQDPPKDAVQAAWAHREDLSAFKPRPYKGELMAPTGAPVIRLTNDSRDNLAIQAGGYVFLQDFVENHGGYVQALLGEDTLVVGQYFYQGWYPTLYLTAYHYTTKFNYGFLLDEDNNAATTNDQGMWQGRNEQYANIAMASMDYPWSDTLRTSGFSRYLEYGFRTTSESAFQPYMWTLQSGFDVNFTNIAYFGSAANPFGGRNVDFNYTFGATDIVFAPQASRSVDDGQMLDAYNYNKVELRWTEQALVPAWGKVLSGLQELRHTLQLDAQLGFIDRNVDRWDEFRAGGQHPFYWGSDSLRPNTMFSGYPSNSLSGETMAQVNLAYRFPLRREWNKRVGPFYFYDVTGQVMGSAGNLWSFRPPENADDFYRNEFGERVARNADSVRREIPFVDEAYKNGNRLLYDAGGEVRVSGSLFNQGYWNSFLRVVYGFNTVRGYGDVNGDDVQDTMNNAIGDELSNEVEEPGVRVYVGLGTGW